MPSYEASGLDEIIQERLKRQAKKSTSQLSTLRFLKSGKTSKISEFVKWEKPDREYLDSIPGRTKSNRRAEALKKKQEEEKALARKHYVDWTPTDEFGNLDLGVNVQVLQIAGLPDPASENREGPIYVNGKRIEGLDLAYPVEHSKGTTFSILQPKKRNYNPYASARYAIFHQEDEDSSEYKLHEPEVELNFIDHQGAINQPYLYLNSLALPQEFEFTISRALARSGEPKLLDLYGNFISESSALYMCDQLLEAMRLGITTSFETLSLSCNPLGSAVYPTLAKMLSFSTSLTALSLSNLFDPLTDADGAILMEGLLPNQSLIHLDLSGNCLSNNFSWALREVLWRHTALQTLNLECNLISDDSSFFIAEALLKNAHNQLHSLQLGWNKVGHVGVGCLMEAVGSSHSKLKIVDFRHNEIVKLGSGNVSDSIAKSTSLMSLNFSHNKLADLSELGLGLHFNGSLTELNVSDNLLADDAFNWFALWKSSDKSVLRSLDFRNNKLGDLAALDIVQGLMARSSQRNLIRIDVSDNLIDPLLVSAISALLDPFRPAMVNRKEAKALVRRKRRQDRLYWKERDWEAQQKQKLAALEDAVKKLNARTEDEVETDFIVGAPVVSRIPVISRIVSAVHEWRHGVKPLWQLQKEMILEQKSRAVKDITLRRGLQKGTDIEKPISALKSKK